MYRKVKYMDAIIYSSRTGFTEKYALMLSEKTGIPAYPVKKARKLAKGSDVIYMGWLMSSIVNGYEKADKKYNVRALCPVGMLEMNDDERRSFELANRTGGVAVFPLRGGFNMDALRGIYRTMMRAMTRSIEAKIEDNSASEAERSMLNLLQNGGDFVDEKNLDPVIEWLNSGCPAPEKPFAELDVEE